MAIFAQCPQCRKKQATKNRVCSCGADLVKLKRSAKVKYWINYRLPNGKQRTESVKGEGLNPYSVESAREMLSKRVVQKKENRVFDMIPEATMTFKELTDWYLDLESVKRLAAPERIGIALTNFNKVFGNNLVASIKLLDLEKYQALRSKEGYAPATIDLELVMTKTMVSKAFDNDMLDGRCLKAFRRVKKALKAGSNARKRTISLEEYSALLDEAKRHMAPLIEVGFNTGMRRHEVLSLRWSYIDREKRVIRLPAEVTKEKREKVIPINHHVAKVLDGLPRSLHHDFVFTNRGGSIPCKDTVTYGFKTACERAGIPYGRKAPDGTTFHDLRRTFKTNMLKAGIDKAYRDLILGHRSGDMDTHYLAPTDETLVEVMDRFTKWLDREMEKEVMGQHLVNTCGDISQ
jgi:integrase